jgi:hypothetical protein
VTSSCLSLSGLPLDKLGNRLTTARIDGKCITAKRTNEEAQILREGHLQVLMPALCGRPWLLVMHVTTGGPGRPEFRHGEHLAAVVLCMLMNLKHRQYMEPGVVTATEWGLAVAPMGAQFDWCSPARIPPTVKVFRRSHRHYRSSFQDGTRSHSNAGHSKLLRDEVWQKWMRLRRETKNVAGMTKRVRAPAAFRPNFLDF